MESITQNEDKLFQNSISYLHNISALEVSSPILKCLYLTKAKLMELRKDIHVPSNLTGTSARCRRCFLSLNNGPATYRIRAEEKKSKFAKKILKMRTQNKPLTKYQRKYFKQLNTFCGNRLVTKCKFCNKEYFVKLEKPKKPIKEKIVQKTALKRKKRNKKDKFCGLNKNVVIPATSKNRKQLFDITKSTCDISKSKKTLPISPKRNKNINTTETKRNFDTSESIHLKINNKKSKFKLSKKENSKESIKEIVPQISIRESQSKLKKKSKLKEFLKSSNSNNQSPSANLKHFLQGL